MARRLPTPPPLPPAPAAPGSVTANGETEPESPDGSRRVTGAVPGPSARPSIMQWTTVLGLVAVVVGLVGAVWQSSSHFSGKADRSQVELLEKEIAGVKEGVAVGKEDARHIEADLAAIAADLRDLKREVAEVKAMLLPRHGGPE